MQNEFFSELRQILRPELAASPQEAILNNPNLSSALCGSEAGTSPPVDRYGEVPIIDPEFHPQLGERLSVFPRAVLIRLGVDDDPRLTAFWPDFNTYIEDDSSRQMMYYPSHRSAHSLHVTWLRDSGHYMLGVFQDELCIASAQAETLLETLESL